MIAEMILNSMPECKVKRVDNKFIHGMLYEPGSSGSFSIQYDGYSLFICRIAEGFRHRISDLTTTLSNRGFDVEVHQRLRG